LESVRRSGKSVREERSPVLTKASLIKAFNKLSRCLKGKTEGTILFHPMTRGIAELEDPSLLKREYRGEGNPTFELSLKLLLCCPALVSEG
jgi:hypothetical protein